MLCKLVLDDHTYKFCALSDLWMQERLSPECIYQDHNLRGVSIKSVITIYQDIRINITGDQNLYNLSGDQKYQE